MIERKKYLDYAKGIGILLIMFSHSVQYFKMMVTVNKFVCSFHVPVFFVASGFLAWINREKQDAFSNVLKKRAKALLIPYAIYSLFNSILKFGVLILKHSLTSEKIQEEFTALLITGNGTVWFLVTLFAIEMLFYLLKMRVKSGFLIFTVILLILPYLLYPFMQNPIGIVFIRVIAGLGFYLAGYCVCGWTEHCTPKKKDTILVGVLITGITSYLVFKSNYSFFEGKFDSPVWSVTTGVFLSIGVVLTCVYLENHTGSSKTMRIFEYFGKNSLIVMLLHPTILLLFTYPFAGKFWGMVGIKSVIIALLLFSIVTLLEVPVIYVVNRWFGWTLGRLKKVERNG